MKKIKLIEFFDKEYEGPKGRIVFISCIGGFFFGMLLFIINQGSEIAANKDADVELHLFFIFLTICIITIASKHYSLNHMLRMTEEVVRKVRVRLINKLRHTELQFIENIEKGEVYTRIAQDTRIISQNSLYFVNTFDAVASCLSILLYIAFLSKTAFLIALLTIGGMYALFKFGYYKIKEGLINARLKEIVFLDVLNDTLSGFKEIKINTRKNNDLFADIEAISGELELLKADAGIKYDKNIITSIGLFLFAIGTIAFITPLFSHTRDENFIKIITAMLFILGMLAIIFRGIFAVIKANVAAENLEKLEARLDKSDTTDTETAAQDISGAFQEIRLRSVCFEYIGKDNETLFTAGPLDLNIRQGEVLFIIGGNGSGKSTLLKLLTGLYYPLSDGGITLNGRAITRKNYQTYRELFSIIFTDFHLFKKLYGLESVDADQVKYFLKEMGLDKKTDYADRQFTNINLSTGQKKRLAYIAAILEDKPVYVFDEWAADQDPVFRKLFYEKFLQDLRAMNKTIIAVTHDDKYFHKADRVIKLKDGKIVEDILI